MLSRKLIALFALTVLLGASAITVSPAGAKTKHERQEEKRKHEREEEKRDEPKERQEERQEGQQCPPGVQDANYCATGNFAGLTARLHAVTASRGGAVDLPLSCKKSITCRGKLYLEGSRGKVLGVAQYSIKRGKRGTVHMRLTSAGRSELKKKGKLSLTISAVSRHGLRSVVGHLLVKSK